MHPGWLRFSRLKRGHVPRDAGSSLRLSPPRCQRRFRYAPSGSIAGAAAVAVFIAASAACAMKTSTPPRAGDLGIPACPPSTSADLLSANALQCWFSAPHGRWRTLRQESHYTVLVVHVAVQSQQDARDIAGRFVAGEGGRFSEILIYAEPESANGRTGTRRVRWTRDAGFEELDF
jgi:hypothetical protein